MTDLILMSNRKTPVNSANIAIFSNVSDKLHYGFHTATAINQLVLLNSILIRIFHVTINVKWPCAERREAHGPLNGLFYAGPFIHPTRYLFPRRTFGEARSMGGRDVCSSALPLVPGREGFFAVKPRAHPAKLVYRVNSWFHGTIFIHHSLSPFSSAPCY